MTVKRFEANGLTDVLATVKHVVEQGGEIDIDTVGGIGSAYFDYHFTYTDTKGETHNVPVKGRVELVKFLQQVLSNGGTIQPVDLGGLGGRNSIYWMDAEMPEVGDNEPQDNPTTLETVEVNDTPEETQQAIEDGVAEQKEGTSTATVEAYGVVMTAADKAKAASEQTVIEPMPDASPAAIDLARVHGIDLRDVEGSGKNGKVNKPDVVKHLDKPQ